MRSCEYWLERFSHGEHRLEETAHGSGKGGRTTGTTGERTTKTITAEETVEMQREEEVGKTIVEQEMNHEAKPERPRKLNER